MGRSKNKKAVIYHRCLSKDKAIKV